MVVEENYNFTIIIECSRTPIPAVCVCVQFRFRVGGWHGKRGRHPTAVRPHNLGDARVRLG